MIRARREMRHGIVAALLLGILSCSAAIADVAGFAPSNETLKEVREEQRKEEDLAAQQGMNEAAQGTLALSIFQTAFAAASTIGLGFTLYFSYHSTVASRAAAASAGEQAEHQRLLLRANILHRGAQAYKEIDEERLVFQVAVQNIGPTAAKEVRLETAMSIAIGQSEARTVNLLPQVPAKDVPADTDHHFVMRPARDFRLTEEEQLALSDNRLTFRVPFKMEFRDAFGEVHTEKGTLVGRVQQKAGDFFADLDRQQGRA
ncbi:hypothetical protein VPK21_002161 (plasmid) [Sinorhizobium kummerowiae]|uniref:hypothetical protein n=1 Tax=Sinorhizobium kummerowiae TaxID=158892 RepID=UPI002B4BE560|nr:hypothetical protein [Sinorhizobium kummerowiae]WRW48868.1 hypothetical protein VPK21_002161 [Sinorhizobium kummerowiae]